MRTSLVLSFFSAFTLPAVPITIVSGTVSFRPENHLYFRSHVDLVTSTGSLTGTAHLVSSDLLDLQFSNVLLPWTGNPSLLFPNAENNLLSVLNNGTTYTFATCAGCPDFIGPDASFLAPNVTVSATGPLIFEVPFTATFQLGRTLVLDENARFVFEYSGAGIATLEFLRVVEPQSIPFTPAYYVQLSQATFTFEPVPEPAAITAFAFGLLALAAVKRLNGCAATLPRPNPTPALDTTPTSPSPPPTPKPIPTDPPNSPPA